MAVFTVEGFLPESVLYVLQCGIADAAADLHGLTGDRFVLAFLMAREGQTVEVTPTGPVYTLDLADNETVLAALHALTTVTAVRGDPPDVFGPTRPGVVH